jgi:hypothetical protein
MKSNSINIDAIDMKHIPFESSHRGESNGIKIIKIQSLDAKIDQGIFKFFMKSNSVNIDATNMKYISFEFFHRENSNDQNPITRC